MFIGAYLCTGALFLAVGALAVSRRWARPKSPAGQQIALGRYILQSTGLLMLALALFIALSLVLGIMHTGGAGSWSYPQDYLASGPIGWIVMVVPILGIVAPLLILVISKQQRGTDESALPGA